jgi:hypothetical protein
MTAHNNQTLTPGQWQHARFQQQQQSLPVSAEGTFVISNDTSGIRTEETTCRFNALSASSALAVEDVARVLMIKVSRDMRPVTESTYKVLRALHHDVNSYVIIARRGLAVK